MKAPNKYWWIVLVAVPVTVAIIGLSGTLISYRNTGGDAPGISYVAYGGVQTNISGDVAFTTLNVIMEELNLSEDLTLSNEQLAILQAAMDRAEAGDFGDAIPLFESIAQVAPVPSVLNNLAASYQAAGEVEKADATLEQATAGPPRSPQADAAIRHNIRRVEVAEKSAVLSSWQPGAESGVVAAVTRCDDAGGMLTVEVTYRNDSSESAYLYVSPSSSYLIDESSAETRMSKVQSTGHNGSFGPGATYISWIKFQLGGPVPERLTVVAHKVQRSFENVPCQVSGS